MNKFAKVQSDKIDQKILKIMYSLTMIREEYVKILNDPSELDQDTINNMVNLIKSYDSQQENFKMSLEAFFKFLVSSEEEDGEIVSEESEDGHKV